jgi:hypothetical protein
MSQPKRIQRRRVKGWKMPPNTVYVGRPTKWGNPWSVGSHTLTPAGKTKSLRKIVRLYRAWMVGTFTERAIEKIIGDGTKVPKQPMAMLHWLMVRGALRNQLSELRGKDLACFCPLDQPCHADVLLELANS